MKNLSFDKVSCNGGFWRFYSDLNKRSILKNVYERFLETGRFEALKCAWREGMPNKPHIFWDSDVVKWLEGAAYILEEERDESLEALVDGMIEDIAENQQRDGYFNSYYITVELSKRFTERGNHELYCLGHMIEAAVAYHKATGKDKLLSVVLKYIDLVRREFLLEKTAAFITPGHEEIELALLRLYEYRGDESHLELARFFINMRGNNDKEKREECVQSNLPVRELSEAVGHSVRACYLYTAMAMLAKIDGDKELLAACHRLFSDIVTKKMSITGGIGADHEGEKFSYAYDLPNSDTYNETCAAISLAMFAGAMQELDKSSAYGNVIERVLYNGFISGVSLDGEKFFYTNPLEIDLKKYSRSTYQPICQRVKVFYCSCCPPNVVRAIASVQKYTYTTDGAEVYCNQFSSGEARLEIDGSEACLTQSTNYPADGNISFSYRGKPMTLFVRIPDWCVEYDGYVDERGFARFDMKDGDSFTLSLPMEIHFIEANPNVQDNSGRYAVQRGPVVYCMEEIDNGENLRDITLIESAEAKVACEEGIPAPVIYMEAERRLPTDALYKLKCDKRQRFVARLIPYFAFANRGESGLIVWTMLK